MWLLFPVHIIKVWYGVVNLFLQILFFSRKDICGDAPKASPITLKVILKKGDAFIYLTKVSF